MVGPGGRAGDGAGGWGAGNWTERPRAAGSVGGTGAVRYYLRDV